MDYYEKIHIFINGSPILPHYGENFGNHDRPRYNKIHVSTSRWDIKKHVYLHKTFKMI